MDTPGIHDAESPDWDEPTIEIPVLVPSTVPPPPAPAPAHLPSPWPSPSPELHSPQVRRLLFAGMAIALLVLGGLVVGSFDHRRPAAAPPAAGPPAAGPPAAGPPAAGPATAAAAAPVGDRDFELVSGAASVTVRTADLGDDLYRINGPAPEATDDGTHLRLDLADRTGPVDLVLADGVRWDLSVRGGADRKRIDLAGGRFRGISLHDGANQVDLRLPHPDGTLTVTLAGGAGRFDVHTAGPVPLRVRVGSGAGQVVLRGETHSGVAAGALFTPEKWDAGGDRIDLDATAGMNLLTVLR